MVTAIAPGVLTPASEPEDPISDSSASVFHHTLITSDFKQLTFDAAASLQLQYKHSASGKHAPYHYAAAKSDHRLIVSPYNSPPHLLDLTSYDHATRLFAKALTIMQPIGDDYATADYLDSFNFGSIFAFLKQLAHAEGHLWRRRDFYVVTFRSQFKPDADEQRLFELDSKSHEEAMASGGLLKYWYGSKNEEFRNLATCKSIFTDRSIRLSFFLHVEDGILGTPDKRAPLFRNMTEPPHPSRRFCPPNMSHIPS